MQLFQFLMYIIEIGAMIFTVVSIWVMFEKGGQAGWKSLIPFYSQYIEYKLADRKNLYWVNLGVSIIFGLGTYFLAAPLFSALIISGYYGVYSPSELIPTFWLWFSVYVAFSLATFIINLIKNMSLAEAYGHDKSFGVGLSILPIIFYGIIAFDRNQYYGPTN